MELRKHHRVVTKTEVWLGQDGIFTRRPETPADLSEGGAFIETTQHFAKGSILNVRLKLPNYARPISCTAMVRNQRDLSGLGVEFLDLSAESRAIVSDFVAQPCPA